MAESRYIRNFCIIAHIDHGKSTLADRMLEITGTIEKRKMQAQVLDSMDLERERGITIKMTPVRMNYNLDGAFYMLNLIDTPGHIDFYYEVSRSLKAVEGCILLVDATQGIQAQTLTTLQMAEEAGLKIIPAISKIDSPLARISETRKELALLLKVSEEGILEVSGKTGEGVKNLLNAIVEKIPPPEMSSANINDAHVKALVFDFQYSNHTGIIINTRVFGGEISKKDKLYLNVPKKEFTPIEVGFFSPQPKMAEVLSAGEIGYIVTGIKEPGIAFVGDTITLSKKPVLPLPGFLSPKPVVWASLYPESQDDFDALRQSLDRLRLSDSSFEYEEESSGVLGRGFRAGFLGMLHLEIIAERLRREFNLDLIITLPSITYEVVDRRGRRIKAYSPMQFPDYGEIEEVFEPWVSVRIILPNHYLGTILPMLYDHEAVITTTDNFGNNRTSLILEMPLRELMRGFFDRLKSVSSGFASLSYQLLDLRKADVVKLEMLVADEPVPAFSRIVSRKRFALEAEEAVEKLFKALPRQMFTTKIQAKGLGRIIASRTISAMRKDVTAHMYGGDITRKMKLREKQKKGKKKMKALGKVNISQDVFLKMIKAGND